MREILFRGKRKDNGEWEQGDLDRGLFANIDFISYFKTIGERVSYEVIPETVGQYTGLTDKNGKKIFEGDIILFDEEYGHIEYDDLDAQFILSFDTWVTTFGIVNSRDVEVIGNIHDNPELLAETALKERERG